MVLMWQAYRQFFSEKFLTYEKEIISFRTIVTMLLRWSPVKAEPLPSQADLNILYENDVHWNVDGYAKIKAL